MHRLLTAHGDAPADTVWIRYVEPARWPGWSPQIRRAESSDPVLRSGSTGRVFSLPGVSFPFTVLSVDDDRRRWAWKVHLPLGVVLTLDHLVQPDGDGSRTALRVHGPAPLVLAYAPLAQIALNRLVRR
ncbi:SRPBCC family protein [Nakamurella flavida]|uniref:SRPBCC family protein n=1 Tax=Nakamurella flavida TaxID=363630 RepID=A0A938YKT2_9ACTN|nr:SRPBCC family protein [Nakamurella flavida]MBM9475257.1 SRPBCC family protein [Nakamurella flavida]MDP9776831.1 hypothetical protein [Nakamurella flavida]